MRGRSEVAFLIVQPVSVYVVCMKPTWSRVNDLVHINDPWVCASRSASRGIVVASFDCCRVPLPLRQDIVIIIVNLGALALCQRYYSHAALARK